MRKIWQGELSWVNPKYDSNQEQVAHSVFCTVSTKFMESSQQPTVCSDNWPKKLIMQMIPRSLVQQNIKYFQNARFLFDFTDNPAKNSLKQVLNQGYAGCVHFHSSEDKKCDIRVLILLFNPRDNNYWGYIPNDQVQFIDCIREAAASVHEGKKPYKCSICDARFARKTNLSGHIASIHEGKKLYLTGSQGQPQ